VFNGNPAPNTNGDPQQTNPSGTSFPLNGGAMYIGEIQYTYPSLGTLISPDEGEPLGRTYKLGFYYNTQNFNDQRYGTDGLSLSDPSSNGLPVQHRGNLAVYAVADQMLWRAADDPDRNINAFARVLATPMGDRNLIKTSVNLGVVMHEPFLQRDDDTFGVALGYANVSRQASQAAADAASFGGTYNPHRSSETFLEATYQYAATPWLQLQPDVQYVFNPGAGQANPYNPQRRIKDELIFGIRTNILF
jgi:porin